MCTLSSVRSKGVVTQRKVLQFYCRYVLGKVLELDQVYCIR